MWFSSVPSTYFSIYFCFLKFIQIFFNLFQFPSCNFNKHIFFFNDFYLSVFIFLDFHISIQNFTIAHDEPRHRAIFTSIFTIFYVVHSILKAIITIHSIFFFVARLKEKKSLYQMKTLCIFSCLVFILLSCVQTSFKRSKHFAVSLLLFYLKILWME